MLTSAFNKTLWFQDIFIILDTANLFSELKKIWVIRSKVL